MRSISQHSNPFTRAMVFIGIASMWFVVSQMSGYTSNNSASRFATIESLYERDTFEISESSFDTIDRHFIGENMYSSKPPLLPAILSQAYGAYVWATGNTFAEHREAAILFIKYISSVAAHLLLLVYAALFLRRFSTNAWAQLLVFFSIAFGHLGVLYAIDLNNHTIGATFAVALCYHALSFTKGIVKNRAWHWGHAIGAGIFGGALASVDVPSSALTLAIGVYLFLHSKKASAVFFGLVAIPLAVQTWLYYSIQHSLDLPQFALMARDVPEGDYWANPIGIDAAKDSRLTYLLHMTIGHHGIFAFTPALLFGCLGLFAKRKPIDWTATLLISVAALVMFAFYLLKTDNYGGVCVGFRWFIPLTPLLLLFAVYPLEWTLQLSSLWKRRLLITLFLCCVAIGFAQIYVNKGDPWRHSAWHRWLGPYLEVSYL